MQEEPHRGTSAQTHLSVSTRHTDTLVGMITTVPNLLVLFFLVADARYGHVPTADGCASTTSTHFAMLLMAAYNTREAVWGH